MPPATHQARSVGRVAMAEVNRVQDGTVIGTTSRGLFVLPESGRILFISRERFRGPLTINVASLPTALPATRPGQVARLGQGSLHLGKVWSLSVSPAALWSPGAPPAPLEGESKCQDRLRTLAREVLARRPTAPTAQLLASLVGFPPPDVALSPPGPLSLTTVLSLRRAIRRGDPEPASELLSSLLGLGPGLTPSGDDLAVGVLLALNRWIAAPWTPARLVLLNRRVRQRARERTTALGASLISCAAEGEADERLLSAIDSIACGEPPFNAVLTGLLGWGNTSGIDVLAGISVVWGGRGSELPGITRE